ncbi:hypothetical protein EDD36DRAFT_240821 [Exophiala viscosa]|uniref:Uncharacterized protein n=1 Tax=Exophiala viscosa TaxID=2486360 RepID=A0AAN6IEI1_9EURO|nr:hypothetical protein EDD36DRAFT_240821 [Exophiala viscosa]
MSWFIPIVVTAGGWLFGKITENLHIFPEPPDHSTPEDTIVRIWAGMNANRSTSLLSSLEGSKPQVVLYDERGDHIGDTKPGGKILEGGFQDFIISPDKKGNNVRPTYLQINIHTIDAICISAIQIQYADGGWSTIYGDVPVQFCGWAGYPSITPFYTGSDGNDIYKPWCFWMDKNDSYNDDWNGSTWNPKDHFSQSANFHIPDFNGQPDVISAYHENHDLLCNSEGRMQGHPWWPETIAVFKPPLSYGNNASDAPGVSHENNSLDPKIVIDDFVGAGKWPQSAKNPHYLVNYKEHKNDNDKDNYNKKLAAGGSNKMLYALFDSDDPSFSADYVCSRPNVFGPHYANAWERKFCNLDDRTVWPFCDDTHTTNCFDMESLTLWGSASAPASGSIGTFDVGSAAIRTPLLSLAGRSTLGM